MKHLLKIIRENNKLTQSTLSKKLEISQGALSQIELQNKMPSMKTFLKLVRLGYITRKNMYQIIMRLADKQGRD